MIPWTLSVRTEYEFEETMNAHVLFLGGTGARIYRALVHCLASGMYHDFMPDDLEIRSYLIDPDTANGDGIRARHIANCYQNIHQALKLDYRSLPDCPLFSTPLHQTDIQPSNVDANSFADLGNDAQLLVSALVGDIGICTNNEMGIYLAMSSVDLSPLIQSLDPYRDLVVVVGGTFGATGYSGMAELACRIRRIHSKCRVAIIPVGPYFKPHTHRGGSVYGELFFIRHSLLKYFYNVTLQRELSEIVVYDVCLSDREVDALRYAEGVAEQNNPSHIVELCAASAIFDLITRPWVEGRKMTFDISAIKAGHSVGLDDFPNEMRKQMDELLCFSIWCRHFAKGTDSAPKENQRFAVDFCQWLEEMKRYTVSFDPIDFSKKELSQSFKWYKPSVQFGLFSSDPLSIKNLDKDFKKAYQKQEDSLPDKYKHLKAEYSACINAWKQFREICK